MPYFDESGNEVSGLLTEAELNEKIEAERAALEEKFNAEKASVSERIGALEAEKRAAQEALDAARGGAGGGDGGDKDVNLANLRKKLEDTTASLEAERQLNAQRFSAIEGESLQQEIDAIARNNADLAKKIRYNYDNVLTGMKGATKEEMRAKVASAYRLSIPAADSPDALSIAIGGGNRGATGPAVSGSEKKFTPKEVAAGRMFGITDQDRAKYSNDPRFKH